MTDETLSATGTVQAPAATVFAALADPTNHPAIDGTGWVREPLDRARLTEAGQVFRMAMYHDNHPDRHYEMANRVRVLDPPCAISWEPGQFGPDGELGVGGWVWRYDLHPASDTATEVTLTYDWSAVPPFLRERIQFPPFGTEHLERSLGHLAGLAAKGLLTEAAPQPASRRAPAPGSPTPQRG